MLHQKWARVHFASVNGADAGDSVAKAALGQSRRFGCAVHLRPTPTPDILPHRESFYMIPLVIWFAVPVTPARGHHADLHHRMQPKPSPSQPVTCRHDGPVRLRSALARCDWGEAVKPRNHRRDLRVEARNEASAVQLTQFHQIEILNGGCSASD